jgi:glycosyltransferase involved in cell wall biosynthesis
MILYSIVIVNLNSGDNLLLTLKSILNQSYKNLEVIIKDGISSDHSLKSLPQDSRIKIIVKKDNGIYDAMNQAIDYCSGNYVIYMNSGDTFFKSNTLNDVNNYISKTPNSDFYYGNTYTVFRNSYKYYPKFLNQFTFYKTVLCHQSTLYNINTLKVLKFNDKYKYSSDIDLYVRIFNLKLIMSHLPVIISSYIGGGASISNKRLALKEKNKILKVNFYNKNHYYFKFLHFITLRSIKDFLSTSKFFKYFYELLSIFYYKIVNKNYGK